MINSDHEEVCGIMFGGTAYELEKVTAADAREIMKGINVDKKFNDHHQGQQGLQRHGKLPQHPNDKRLVD